MAVQSRTLTYDDLIREREIRDERLRLELIDGEIVVTPSPALFHQIIDHRLTVLLDRAIVEPGLGLVIGAPFDVTFDEQNTVQPDLIVVLHDRTQALESGTVRIENAPGLAIEIISPSSKARDRMIKRDLYARFGVPEYWLVDHERGTVTVFSGPRDGRYETENTTNDVAVSATIPGLTVDLAVLFAPVRGA